MTTNQDAIDAGAEAIMDAAFGQELPEAPYDLAEAAYAAMAPFIEVAALRSAADAAFRSKQLHGLHKTLIGNYLRARAAGIEAGK